MSVDKKNNEVKEVTDINSKSDYEFSFGGNKNIFPLNNKPIVTEFNSIDINNNIIKENSKSPVNSHRQNTSSMNSNIVNNTSNNINNTFNSNLNNIKVINNKPIDLEKQKQKELMQILHKANTCYNKAVKNSSQYYYKEAYEDFCEAKKLTMSVYDQLKVDNKTKDQMDHFLKALEFQISNTDNFKKNQFVYNNNKNYSNYDKKTDEIADEIKKVFNKNQSDQVLLVKNEKKQELIKKSPDRSNNIKTDNVKTTTNNKSNIPDDMREKILSEIIDTKPEVKFCDIIGLQLAKQTLKEIIVLPTIRPDLFTGLRAPPRGLLLFGPPGTGKTMLAKAVATECNCTFFNISASSLTSKYVGESEKLVKALFELAFEKQPSVVFIDEIDSILSKRGDNENEASKRLKTEFLVQFDGVGSHTTAKVLIIGATNRPMELDSAVIRRLPKRIYIGAFDEKERFDFLKEIMKNQENTLTDDEMRDIASKTESYSNSDLKELCREAAYGPIRDIETIQLATIEKLRPVNHNDLLNALKKVRGILNDQLLNELVEWDKNYGATI